MQLDSQNEWVKNANRLPWKVWEASYASLFPGIKGCVAKPCRMVIGSFIIQQRMGFSDRDLVKQIQENPYYQYFIGIESFQHTPPFASTLLVEWRKRIDVSFVIKANDALCDAMPKSRRNKKSFGLSSRGTLVATKYVSNIDYFGEPLYTYSLKEGIEDGFLAPFKVINVKTNIGDGWRPYAGQRDIFGNLIEDRIYNNSDYDYNIILEDRINEVAREITAYLKYTGRMQKTIIRRTDP